VLSLYLKPLDLKPLALSSLEWKPLIEQRFRNQAERIYRLVDQPLVDSHLRQLKLLVMY